MRRRLRVKVRKQPAGIRRMGMLCKIPIEFARCKATKQPFSAEFYINC